nr:unnamed protein product [Spirometra erinaceieuropaei]
MVSSDVTSLFTSITPNLAREFLRRRLEEVYDETQNALKIEHIIRLFEFCQHTFFTFAGETYEQIKGTPMGSPVSGLVAELVLQEVEKVAFIQHCQIKFWMNLAERPAKPTTLTAEKKRCASKSPSKETLQVNS